MIRGSDFTLFGIPAQPDTWFIDPDIPVSENPRLLHPEAALRDDRSEPLHALRQARLVSTRRAPGTCSLWKLLRETGINLFESAQLIVGALVGSMAANALSARMPGAAATPEVNGNLGESLALATSMSAAATGFLTKTVTAISQSRLSDKDALRETYTLLVDHSKEEISRYPAPVQAAIQTLDRSVHEAFVQKNQNVAWHEQKLRHREQILMSIPYYAKNIAQWDRGNTNKLLIAHRIKRLVDSYPEENRDTLENLIQRMRANSIAVNPSRVQAYLYGPPGTGKTRFIKELAAALGLPVIEIRVPPKHLASLYGLQWSVDYASANTSDREILGELPEKLIRSGFTNPIVFFDELTIANNHVLNGLNLLLDGAKKTIRVEAFNLDLDWSRATVICASNDKLTNAALKTRTPQLDFLRVERSVKELIVIRQFAATMLIYENALDQKNIRQLSEQCRAQLAFMLDKDTLPGARNVEGAAESLMHYIAAGLIDGPVRSQADIKRRIERDLANFDLQEEPVTYPPPAPDSSDESD